MTNADPFNEALKAIFFKSSFDQDFRSLALSDPAAALRAVSHIKDAPSDLAFVESEDSSRPDAFVLPPYAPYSDELSEYQLESVAGGVFDVMNPQYTHITQGQPGCAGPDTKFPLP